MALNPLFTVPFDVESSDNYGDFIADLRNRLANPRHFSHNCPVLPPVEPGVVPPSRWFHVVLKTQTSTLTLATRADNLYLEGFQGSDGTWWELTRDLIPGATYAGFGGSYPDLLRDTDRLLDVSLGPKQMTEAVNVLAARTRAQQQRAKDAVVVLLLMVHEATRFQTVSGLVAGLMHPKTLMPPKTPMKSDNKITPEMKAQVNGWEDLSAALLKTSLLKTDARPPVQFVGDKGGLTAENAKKMGVDTVEKATKTVGILLFVEDPKVKGMMTAATALRLFRGN